MVQYNYKKKNGVLAKENILKKHISKEKFITKVISATLFLPCYFCYFCTPQQKHGERQGIIAFTVRTVTP